MNKRFFNICNLYVFLWLLMKTQGILYESVLISVALYAITIAISLCYAVKCYQANDNPPFVKAYNVLFALLCVYGAVNYVIADVHTTYKQIPSDFYLQNIVKSMIPFYAFYAFAKQGLINLTWLRWFMAVFLGLTINAYYMKESLLFDSLSSDIDGVTNNVGYIFVSLLPLTCFWNNKKVIQYALLAICSFFIIMSMKRGAIITAAAVMLVFIAMTGINNKSKKRFVNLILIIAVVLAVYFFVSYLLDTSEYFGKRVEDTLEGYSSQRDYLYSYYWNLFWNDSNPLQFLFGRGADGTIHTGHNYAHNDWLEILIDQGVIGIVVFLFFWITLIKLWRKYPINNLGIALGMCVVFLLSRTFFSMSINDMSIYSTSVLGVAVAAYYNKNYMASLTE